MSRTMSICWTLRSLVPSAAPSSSLRGGVAAKVIQEALGIESDEVANYVFPKTWPNDREQRARIIGEWLQTEARFLAE